MPNCPVIKDCAFFNDRMANMPSIAKMYKERYCIGEYEKCARYIVHQRTGKAHPTLMPNQENKIEEAVKELDE